MGESAVEADNVNSSAAGSLHALSWAMDHSEPYGMSAWMKGPWNGGKGVVVASLDSGLSSSVLDVFQDLQQGYDFVSDPSMSVDGDGRDGDWVDPGDAVPGRCGSSSWHGTLTGTMLACEPSRTQSGYAGVVPNATFMPVRVLGACKTGYASDVADAIVWAAGGEIRGLDEMPAKQAQVILMAFSGKAGCPSYLQSAVDLAVSRNITLVASGGNNYGDTVSNYFPGNCLGVYSVGAMNRRGGFTAYTNRGARLYFPGGDAEYTLTCMSDDGHLVPCTGTSFAAAYAAGWVASSIGKNGYFEIVGPTVVQKGFLNVSNYSMNASDILAIGDDNADCGTEDDFFTPDISQYAGCCSCVSTTHTEFGWYACPTKSCTYHYFTSGAGDRGCACKAGYYATSQGWRCSSYLRTGGNGWEQPPAPDSFTCSLCPSGSYCTGGLSGTSHRSSQACAAGTSSSAGASSCTQCGAGKYSSSGAGSCTDCTCQPSTYITGSCPAGSTSNTRCSTCPDNTYSCLDWGHCQPCKTCAVDQFRSGTCTKACQDFSCNACPAGSYSLGGGATSCTSCPGGQYFSRSTGQCTACSGGCPAGQYQSSGCSATADRGCLSCTAGVSFSAAGAASCTTCRATCAAGEREITACTTTTNRECTPCDAGTYSAANSGSCTACTGNQYSAAGATACITCGAGNYLTGNSQCTACEAGKITTAAGTATCTNCAAGKYQFTAGQSTCGICGTGGFSTHTGSYSIASYPNSKSFGFDDQMHLLTIGPSYGTIRMIMNYSTETNKDIIYYTTYRRADGSPDYWHSSRLSFSGTAFGIGLVSTTGYASFLLTMDFSNNRINPFSVTYSATGGPINACLACDSGSFSNSPSGATACTACNPGSYQSLFGQTSCTPCAAGTASGDASRTAVCPSCTAGKFSQGTGNSICTECAAGKASAALAATSSATCQNCVGRNVSSFAGSTVCSPCGTDIPVASSATPHTCESIFASHDSCT